jgi:NAD(P)H dehydrogenase (quinone)
VFTTGFAYGGGGTMWYDNGGLKGRRALVSMTTGAAAPAFDADGIHGEIERILWPIHNGILHFCGFKVLRPEIYYGVSRVDDAARAAMIERYRGRLLTLEREEPLYFHPLDDFGADHRLKPGVTPRTGFQYRA